jgi:hypothetical protein
MRRPHILLYQSGHSGTGTCWTTLPRRPPPVLVGIDHGGTKKRSKLRHTGILVLSTVYRHLHEFKHEFKDR